MTNDTPRVTMKPHPKRSQRNHAVCPTVPFLDDMLLYFQHDWVDDEKYYTLNSFLINYYKAQQDEVDVGRTPLETLKVPVFREGHGGDVNLDAEDVVGFMNQHFSERYGCDDGGPEVYWDFEAPEAQALQEAIDAYIEACGELYDVCPQPTDMTLVVEPIPDWMLDPPHTNAIVDVDTTWQGAVHWELREAGGSVLFSGNVKLTKDVVDED